MDLWAILGALVTPVVTVFGTLLLSRLKTQDQLLRAQLLSRIARDVAAVVKSNNPGLSLPELIERVAVEMQKILGLPTHNANAIRRAAAGALDEPDRPR